jgi:hypothetical protein
VVFGFAVPEGAVTGIGKYKVAGFFSYDVFCKLKIRRAKPM